MPDQNKKWLIVNADDFGYSAGTNEGILHAHRHGIVTSTSVMVRWPAASAARLAVEESPDLSLGLHVDVGEWIYQNDRWVPLYEVLERGATKSMVKDEVRRQLDTFRHICGRDPTHLDSHQHAHRDEPLREVMLSLAADLAVPLRHFDPRFRYVGSFYGQGAKGEPYPIGTKVETLIRLIGEVAGVTELACHPGLGADVPSPYNVEREAEVVALCDRRVGDAVRRADLDLIGFAAVRGTG